MTKTQQITWVEVAEEPIPKELRKRYKAKYGKDGEDGDVVTWVNNHWIHTAQRVDGLWRRHDGLYHDNRGFAYPWYQLCAELDRLGALSAIRSGSAVPREPMQYKDYPEKQHKPLIPASAWKAPR